MKLNNKINKLVKETLNFEVDSASDVELNTVSSLHKTQALNKRVIDNAMHKAFNDCFAVLFSSKFQYTSPYDNKYFIEAAKDLKDLINHYTYQITREDGEIDITLVGMEYAPNFVNILGSLMDGMMAFENINLLKGDIDFSWLDASKVTNLNGLSEIYSEGEYISEKDLNIIANIFDLVGISSDTLANIIINTTDSDNKLLTKIYEKMKK